MGSHLEREKVMHLRMTGGPLRSSDPSHENRHENTSHCCRFWSRCGVARFCPARQRTPSPAKVQLVAVECPPAMGAQPKQFRRSKLRRISAIGELIGGRDCFERRDRRAPPLPELVFAVTLSISLDAPLTRPLWLEPGWCPTKRFPRLAGQRK
jgi:hypothetical protein